MNVDLLLIATRRYRTFVPGVLASAADRFFPDDPVTVHLFCDRPPDPAPARFRVLPHPVPPYGFPEATLRRFEMFSSVRLDGDFAFYCDVDARFEADVAGEVVPSDAEEFTAVAHAAYPAPGSGTWETRPGSTAYVPPAARRRYYAGGLVAGLAAPFAAMSRALAADVAADRAAGVRAVWHDESHWNAYLAGGDPLVLGPEYCWPEEQPNPARRLVALWKDNHREWHQPEEDVPL